MTFLARLKLKPVFVLACLVAAAAFPLVVTNPAYTQIAVYTLAFAAAGTAWNIFSGYTGYIALGHATFFGLGAYTIAKLCEWLHTPGGWRPFLWVPVAGLVAAAFAIPLGLIALRTRRHTFVVITIAIFFIFQTLALNLRSLTAGTTGIELPIPITWFGYRYGLPLLPFYSGYVANLPFYYVTLLLLVLATAVSWWVRGSKFGLELLAIRDDEDRARGLGVRTGPTKLAAFVLSAFFVGMMGAVMAYLLHFVQPTSDAGFNALYDVTIALMAFLGGLGTLAGPILGALLIVPAQQEFVQLGGASSTSLILTGALFLGVLLLLPEGIVPTLGKLWRRVRRSSQATPVAPGPATPVAAESAVLREGL
jgi:branched-chain amino acid transport system permease protein